MESALSHLCDRVVLNATVTLDEVQVRPDLPVDFFPGNSIGLSDEGHKFLKVPILVNHVLSPHLAVRVNEASAFSAAENFSLLFRKQLVTVSTLV